MAEKTPEELAAEKAKAEADKAKMTAAEKAAVERAEAAEAEAEKWKAMSRKHEGQAKDNAEAAAKLKAAEDAKKSDEERTAERLADLETKLAASDARAMRAEVAAAKGLTPAQAKRLQGSTVEELEADADDLLASFKPADTDGSSDKDKDKDASGKPKEKLRSGAASEDSEPVELDPRKLAEAIPRT